MLFAEDGTPRAMSPADSDDLLVILDAFDAIIAYCKHKGWQLATIHGDYNFFHQGQVDYYHQAVHWISMSVLLLFPVTAYNGNLNMAGLPSPDGERLFFYLKRYLLFWKTLIIRHMPHEAAIHTWLHAAHTEAEPDDRLPIGFH